MENQKDRNKTIKAYEPWFFILFGLFHMHRIWALIDRGSYSSFWMNLMINKGVSYYALMGILTGLCLLGIITFIKNIHNNYWWRWIYLFGGAYVLFDLFAIATGLKAWRKLLDLMFDTASPYWNFIWVFFILMGTLVFILGITLLAKRKIVRSLDDGNIDKR